MGDLNGFKVDQLDRGRVRVRFVRKGFVCHTICNKRVLPEVKAAMASAYYQRKDH